MDEDAEAHRGWVSCLRSCRASGELSPPHDNLYCVIFSATQVPCSIGHLQKHLVQWGMSKAAVENGRGLVSQIEGKNCLSEAVESESPTSEERRVCGPGIPVSRSHGWSGCLAGCSELTEWAPSWSPQLHISSTGERARWACRAVTAFSSHYLHQQWIRCTSRTAVRPGPPAHKSDQAHRAVLEVSEGAEGVCKAEVPSQWDRQRMTRRGPLISKDFKNRGKWSQ